MTARKSTKMNNNALQHNLDHVPAHDLPTAINNKLNNAVKIEYAVPSNTAIELKDAIDNYTNDVARIKSIFAKIADQCFKNGLEKIKAGKVVADCLNAKSVTHLVEDKEIANRLQAMWHYEANKFYKKNDDTKLKSEKEKSDKKALISVGDDADMDSVFNKLKEVYTIKQLKILADKLKTI